MRSENQIVKFSSFYKLSRWTQGKKISIVSNASNREAITLIVINRHLTVELIEGQATADFSTPLLTALVEASKAAIEGCTIAGLHNTTCHPSTATRHPYTATYHSNIATYHLGSNTHLISLTTHH